MIAWGFATLVPDENVRRNHCRAFALWRNETRLLSLTSVLRVNSGTETKRPPEGGLSELDEACHKAKCARRSPLIRMPQPTLAPRFIYAALARSVKSKSRLQPRNKEGVACTTQYHRETSYSNATPSGSFSSNHISAASTFANTFRWSASPTSLLVLT
jgi:hypothetical protein